MLLYSEKIIQFTLEVKKLVKEILSQEVKVKVTTDRFFDLNREFSYPISIVIYNDRSMLGYFDPNFYEMGFHKRLMFVDEKELSNVIRHEIAHYFTFIRHGYRLMPHGMEFRSFCRQVGWGEDVYSATMELNLDQINIEEEESDIFRKVQKLMALSTSSNKHEAELAMIKSQQLLLKHNLNWKYMGLADEEEIVLKRIMLQSQRNAKMGAIAQILSTFFVSVIFSRGKNGVCLEILGSPLNVQIAEYVSDILQNKLDDLWEIAKKEHHLKGAVEKNSFFLGIAKGYVNKISAFKKSYSTDDSKALMVIEGKLEDAKSMVYKRLSSCRSQGRYSKEASFLGELAGGKLNINAGVTKSTKLNAFIEHKK